MRADHRVHDQPEPLTRDCYDDDALDVLLGSVDREQLAQAQAGDELAARRDWSAPWHASRSFRGSSTFSSTDATGRMKESLSTRTSSPSMMATVGDKLMRMGALARDALLLPDAKWLSHLSRLRQVDRVYTGGMKVEPAFAVSPHIRHGEQDELHAWFTDPPGAVLQLSKPQHFTLEQAEWLVGPGFEQLRSRFPNGEKLILVLDYRNMTSRDTRARTLMMERARDIAQMLAHITVVPPHQPNPVYRTMLHAAVALVSAFGAPIEIVDSFDEVIARHALRAQLS